jgi:hypothetical protein
MDLQKMIAELTAERDRLDLAILALERLAAGAGRRRGRPPKWLQNSAADLNDEDPDETLNGASAKGKKREPRDSE